MHIYKNGELIEESRFATICKHFPASFDFGVGWRVGAPDHKEETNNAGG